VAPVRTLDKTVGSLPFEGRQNERIMYVCVKAHANINMHAFNQRILAEDLVRVRRPDERERYAAAPGAH